jgi:homoserine kinase
MLNQKIKIIPQISRVDLTRHTKCIKSTEIPGVSVKVRSHATLANFGAGFDCIGVPLDSLFDEVVLVVSPSSRREFSRKISGVDKAKVEQMDCVYEKMYDYVLEAYEITTRFKVSLSLNRGIPVGAGLGSSASAAAGAAKAVYFALEDEIKTWLAKDMKLESADEIDCAFLKEVVRSAVALEAHLSEGLHVDNVIPALVGRAVVCAVLRGDTPEQPAVEFFPIRRTKPLAVLIVTPQKSISTGASRKKLCKKEVSLSVTAEQMFRLARLVDKLSSEAELEPSFFTDLIATPSRRLDIAIYPELEATVRNEGCVGFGISGSGPTMFSVWECGDRAKKMANIIANRWPDLKLLKIVNLLGEGSEMIPSTKILRGTGIQ